MTQAAARSDTIAALATAAGEGAIAVVRVSGARSAAVLAQLFEPRRGLDNGKWPSHRMLTGTARNADGRAIDDCMAVFFRGPNSFTGEDSAELHLHGGQAVVRAVLDSCLSAGCRAAAPGEFTKRAFLNGRIDLCQAEAVADLIAARTEEARAAAIRQLRGGLTARIMVLRERLIDAAAEIEAQLDFPEEDLPAASGVRLHSQIVVAVIELDKLLAQFAAGRIAREGARVVLAGRPNAGKSSLFNALIGRERAIVTPHPGTTRDTIEASVDLQGIEVTFVDTAGLRETTDEIEQLGIGRSREAMEQAELVVMVIDGTEPTIPDDAEAARSILVWNKCDLPRQADAPAGAVAVSATTGDGLSRLTELIRDRLGPPAASEEIVLTNARHADCLRQARTAAERAAEALKSGESGEFVMVDLRDCLLHLGEVVGQGLDEEVLDRIFSRFCIGK